ncbi:MAG: hypothetical protein AAGL98_04285, partial [Planctomycetota bacterium]
MDELDANLMVAWDGVRAKLRGDRAALGRRYERGLRAALRRPPRAWCLSIRASDTRIKRSAFIEPERVSERLAHRLLMFGDLIRHLCKPVEIDWPGVVYDDAATRLGIDPRTIYDWIRHGWVESRRERVPGRRGSPTRHVWTRPGGIDVGCPQGRGPEWGVLWRDLYRKVPGHFEQVIRRVPRLRSSSHQIDEPSAGDFRGDFRGWDWECPGRMAADGTELGCGRRCKKLIAPLPVWTIERAMGPPSPSSPPPEVPPEVARDASGRATAKSGAARLGAGRLVADASPRRSRFACAECWNPQHLPRSAGGSDAAWNQL